VSALGAAAAVTGSRGADSPPIKGEMPLIVSTWPFAKASKRCGVESFVARRFLAGCGGAGIWVTESDTTNKSVGLSGNPNAAGVVQLDACIMDGPTHKAGSVGAIEGIRHPISAARRVMEKTKHVLLVGEGARMFALEEGLESVEVQFRGN